MDPRSASEKIGLGVLNFPVSLLLQENVAHELLERMESATLGEMLDLLSKELDRLIVDERLRTYSREAERERRLREAEESGRRQLEERRRREQDEYFRQVHRLADPSIMCFKLNRQTRVSIHKPAVSLG